MAYVENGALQNAIDNAAVGEVVTLTSNITLNSRITVSNVVTLDLNGYSISANVNDGYGAIYIGTKGALTIIDSSITQSGCIKNVSDNAIGNYGSVTISGGTYIGKYALYNFYYNENIYGTSVINGGVFKSIDGKSLAIANCGDLTINGGDIENIDTTNMLTVTNGTLHSLYIGVADYNPPKQSTIINGGHIDTLDIDNNTSNEISISGGHYGCEVDSKYFAEGFELAYDEGTGTYGVVADSDNTGCGLKVIATSSSRIKDLIIQNGQLIFIKDLRRIAFDFNNKRTFYNQIVELDTEADRQALESPLNGYYFVIDTACLWYYKNEWTQITERPEEVVFIGVELPELGQANKIYVDIDDKEISVWDEKSETYVAVSNYTEDASNSDIESLFI